MNYLNSSWSFYPEPDYLYLLPLLVVVSLVVEVGFFYLYFRSGKISMVEACAIITLGNVLSAVLGIFLYALMLFL